MEGQNNFKLTVGESIKIAADIINLKENATKAPRPHGSPGCF